MEVNDIKTRKLFTMHVSPKIQHQAVEGRRPRIVSIKATIRDKKTKIHEYTTYTTKMVPIDDVLSEY